MATGRCNCGSINISIPAIPEQSAICYCANCRRAGSCAGSIIFIIDGKDVKIEDKKNSLKDYTDADTVSGNTITRRFCSNCGSPVMSVPGGDNPTVYLKGGLFDRLPPPTFKSFEQEEPDWLSILKPGSANM
ncbi:hypothetical protein IAQ61_005590 [Plenodomus lingam]|uniref:Similar to glutathione-dependent formaldehyde-activating n=1 Tax=Leptosphaeria maculans (strain JN3 / isolate v23.1.3 / race Av1-4-5-6-7-8) TaxID=985895 RepID=E4ZYL7_LEPMJ|nr:similar to glutathione-dependent formaldehyde-activating [Plenodomus lingam JN3]KAH9871411.1 hypothetical protein IAQ61_005590 [Plenodomus lingam]CBX96543.1 similar to glutathione-dependent formaldehyde-activating [Plenodomus lingam JN3]